MKECRLDLTEYKRDSLEYKASIPHELYVELRKVGDALGISPTQALMKFMSLGLTAWQLQQEGRPFLARDDEGEFWELAL